MSDEIAELWAAAARVREAQHAAARCPALEHQIAQAEAALSVLKGDIAYSEHRVHGLEGLSLGHAIAALRGRTGEAIDTARAEVRAAQVELATRETALAHLRAEHAAARACGALLPAESRELEHACRRREAAIIAAGGTDAAKLDSLARRRAVVADELYDADELIACVCAAADALGICQDRLLSARGWATNQTFFNGGILAASMEHARIDDAASAISRAEAALQALAAEIDSLRNPSALLPDISPGLKTANIWFGNVITDWKVRSRIVASLDSVHATVLKVHAFRRAVQARRDAIAAELGEIDAAHDAILRG